MISKQLLLLCLTFAILSTNAQKPFITTWNTRNIGVTDSTHINFYATGNNFKLSWVNLGNASDTGNTVGISGANTISFPVPGIYKVYITPGSGSFSAITMSEDYTRNKDDGNKLLSIEQWGDIKWSTFNTAFANCQIMAINALDKPNLNNVTDMFAAFFFCRSLTTNAAMSSWDVSNVTDMSSMFSAAVNFNQPIGNWNVSKVTNMSYMFKTANSFNQPIGNWNVNKVSDMHGMFYFAISFNQPVGNWDVSSVTNMRQMFTQASSFNQPIGNWYVSNVRNMGEMLSLASSFNQPIGNWDVGNVTDMNSMFGYAGGFNQPIGDWNVSKVINMDNMFEGAISFNQPIGNWNVSNVRHMSQVFTAANSFNQPIGNWDVGKVTDMSSMFSGASSFNQPIGDWDVSKVKRMDGMFYNASSFNQPIGNWDVSKVTDMLALFYAASSFNQPIGDWDVSNVTDMRFMFYNAKSFNQPIDKWDVSKVTNMLSMFYAASSFNQPLDMWNVSKVANMAFMFYAASSFNQPIGNWKLNSIMYTSNTSWLIEYMLDSCGMNCSNYSITLNGWAANPDLTKNLLFGAANLTYDSANAKTAHDSLINEKGWTITGDIIGHCSVILPVIFDYFTTELNNPNVALAWSTVNEQSIKYYSVERSTDSVNFIEIGQLISKKSDTVQSYSYVDENIAVTSSSKTLYYRVAAVYNNDSLFYTNINVVYLRSIDTTPVDHPLVFKNFKAVNSGNNVDVSWKVLHETSIKYYSVERSEDSINFTEISQLTSKKSDTVQSYSYVDENIAVTSASKTLYYLVTAVDDNDSLIYTEVDVVHLKSTDSTPVNKQLILKAFKAIINNNNVDVSWRALHETNVKYYSLQRSSDSTVFTDISKIASTKSESVVSYYRTDKNIVKTSADKILYYRVAAISKDGSVRYTKIDIVNLSKDSTPVNRPPSFSISVEPNPVHNVVNIHVIDFSGNLTVKVVDVKGNILIKQPAFINGNANISIPFSNFASGIYFLNINTSIGIIKRKVVKQ